MARLIQDVLFFASLFALFSISQIEGLKFKSDSSKMGCISESPKKLWTREMI